MLHLNDSSTTNIINNLTITSINAKNTYGLYSNNGTITMETGTIDVSGINAYGIYLNSSAATVDLGTKDGSVLKTADVSINDPLVKAIGSTLGIGVKSNSGVFYFYDGKLIGSTYAKPETAQITETGWESR